jgi:hypothetical protein
MIYNVHLSSETASMLFTDILIEDYRNMKKDTAFLEARLLTLEPFEFEDLLSNRRWLSAMETLMEYYVEYERRLEIIGKDGG